MESINKWQFKKYSSLTGVTLVEYRNGESVIEASSGGIFGKLNLEFPTNDDIQDFAKAFSEACKHHRALRAQVLETLSIKAPQ